MFNRRSEQLFGLFSFPFISGPHPQQQQFHVRETETELIIEGELKGFKREDIKIEFMRNGLMIVAEQKMEKQEEGEGGQATTETLPVQKVERFFTIHFPFTENDVKANFSEEGKLTIGIAKNDANRKYISIE